MAVNVVGDWGKSRFVLRGSWQSKARGQISCGKCEECDDERENDANDGEDHDF